MARSVTLRTARDTYRIMCNSCGRAMEWRYHQIPREHRKFKVTCTCGHVSRVACERRRDTRKPVNIAGYLFAYTTKVQCDDITIVDLSCGGIAFTTEQLELQVGDQFTVGFFLDDATAAWIEQDVEVRSVQGSRQAGAAFINPELYSVDLDFYLMTVSVIDEELEHNKSSGF